MTVKELVERLQSYTNPDLEVRIGDDPSDLIVGLGWGNYISIISKEEFKKCKEE